MPPKPITIYKPQPTPLSRTTLHNNGGDNPRPTPPPLLRRPGPLLAAQPRQHKTQLDRFSLRRVQIVRRLIRFSPIGIPHGPGPNPQHHRLPNLVRTMGRPAEGDHPRLHPLDLRRQTGTAVRRRVVENRPALHRPDRRQGHRDRHAQRGNGRRQLLPRKVPHAPLRAVRDQGGGLRCPPSGRRAGRLVPPADVG
ncbi:protein exordium-like 3 [Phtheirospermum japonicum]|uniref:Protein exordium-like 3 n=1 Tax=Phtheirospermum japonicum TaxID=374723 RepID=A0A830CBB0_9LAMI|nr:protein exordium-like 3 [Phtheirospermum japonicum]